MYGSGAFTETCAKLGTVSAIRHQQNICLHIQPYNHIQMGDLVVQRLQHRGVGGYKNRCISVGGRSGSPNPPAMLTTSLTRPLCVREYDSLAS